ncbi:MAG: hypothetical protein SWX82_32440 [Cyanobacteriota bacterium]|nr:hypothetical protein [Cyanobacteriota bacterium]
MRDSQRLDWLNRTRCQVDRCSLISCPIGEIQELPDYYFQQSALKQTKKVISRLQRNRKQTAISSQFFLRNAEQTAKKGDFNENRLF